MSRAPLTEAERRQIHGPLQPMDPDAGACLTELRAALIDAAGTLLALALGCLLMLGFALITP